MNGISMIVLPMKYANDVYNLEFSSLKNTSLSTGNCNNIGNIDVIRLLTDMKNIANIY